MWGNCLWCAVTPRVIGSREDCSRKGGSAGRHNATGSPAALRLLDLFHPRDYAQARSDAHNGEEDCCLAAEKLMLAACSMGLGSCPTGFARPWLN